MVPLRWSTGDRLSLDRLGVGRAESATNAGLVVDAATGLELVKAPWGRLLRRSGPEPTYGTLSGTGPAYSFVEAIEGGGTWAAGPRSGTAYEVNGVTGLAGSRQWLHPDRAGSWRFQSVRAGTSPGGGGTVGGLTCGCPTLPETFYMVSSDEVGNYQQYRSCTFQYGPKPPEYATLAGPDPGWYSVQSFADPLSAGAVFRYEFSCGSPDPSGLYKISQLYAASPYSDPAGGPYGGGPIYHWNPGGANTCTPFSLHSGTPDMLTTPFTLYIDA